MCVRVSLCVCLFIRLCERAYVWCMCPHKRIIIENDIRSYIFEPLNQIHLNYCLLPRSQIRKIEPKKGRFYRHPAVKSQWICHLSSVKYLYHQPL